MPERFVPLLIVTLLAFIVPIALSRFKALPIVVGEIMAGIVIGPSLLGWIQPDEPTLELLAEIGFAFLMFLSGLEIDFTFLRTLPAQKRRPLENPILLGGLTFGLTLVLAFLVSEGFMQAGFIPDPWMMTLILSTTSLGIVVPVLKERRLLGSRLGQALLISALLADFLTMFLITVYVTLHVSGLSFEILLVGVLFLPLAFIYLFISKYLRGTSLWRLLEDLSDATSQIKVRGALALMMAFVVLAESLGVELILGAFLSGVLVSLISTPEDEPVRHKLDAIGYGFFIPLFFIDVGVQFDLHAFLNDPRAWILFPLMILAAFAIKSLASLPFRAAFSWRETLAGGLLLSARLSLIVAASAIGLRLGVISEAVNASIVLTAAVSATLAPLAFNLLLPETRTRRTPVMVVFGSNELALRVGQYLHQHGDRVRFCAPSAEGRKRVQQAGFTLLPGSSLAEGLEAMPPQEYVHALLTLAEEDDRNLQACLEAQTHGVGNVIAYVNDPRRLNEYRAAQARVMAPALYRVALLGLMARTPAIFELLTTTTDDKDVREVSMENPALDGKSLREVAWPDDTLILAIRRGEEVIVPHGSTHLELHDHISVLGKQKALENLETLLAQAI